MSIAIIINPVSGAGGADAGRKARMRCALAREVLGARGGEVSVSEWPGHAVELAKDAVARGLQLVVAWGGDGTVNEVARVLAFTPTALGIVPAGSGNGLARALGVPHRPADALRSALDGTRRQIDAGHFAGRLFFNVAGLGFDAHVARRFSELRARGFMSYLRVGLGELRCYVPRTYRIRVGEEAIDHRALMVVVSNGPEFGNRARLAPAARLDDGELDLVIVEPTTPMRDMLRARYLFDGSLARRPGIVTRRVQEVTVDPGDAPIDYHVDGEPGEVTGPVTIGIHPGALWVSCARQVGSRNSEVYEPKPLAGLEP